MTHSRDSALCQAFSREISTATSLGRKQRCLLSFHWNVVGCRSHPGRDYGDNRPNNAALPNRKQIVVFPWLWHQQRVPWHSQQRLGCATVPFLHIVNTVWIKGMYIRKKNRRKKQVNLLERSLIARFKLLFPLTRALHFLAADSC